MVWTCGQKLALLRHWLTITDLLAPRIMGKTCRKSPPKTIRRPPKGAVLSMISWKDRLTVSIKSLLTMEHSSQTMIFALLMKEAIADRGVMSHIVLVVTSNGILKVEWAVRPPTNNNAAVPLEATAIAISPSCLIRFSNALNTKVLQVPPGPSTKNILGPRTGFSSKAASRIVLYTKA
ncbi:hypothetical protein [Parasitella parasitica]|uniref:Uncharacterized protein n=1 Tax=Parasitella parasitica TaxID=35722 RepID=A0A0B7N0J1_9FUNG|nr:hypothetical protein [Parasitella parasitica]